MRHIHILLAIFSVLVLGVSCSCSRVQNVSVQDFRVARIVPQTFKTIDLDISAKVVNGGRGLDVDSITGSLIREGVVIGTFEATPFSIPEHSDGWVDLDVSFTLSPEVSLRYILAVVREADLSQFSVDYKACLKAGCIKINKKGHDIPIAELIDK